VIYLGVALGKLAGGNEPVAAELDSLDCLAGWALSGNIDGAGGITDTVKQWSGWL
jgi:hypothetical protein